ncbi:hypothetical protein K443DRAFT_161498 [Laccaria amethystina LaAM-08-1]|uniref:Uncharacterized protein n=1 Tax=Laccaria amethystina LaAM-08-1 TaxID=1095629 RepID=A0A0C9XUN3_9AGAR|nr:hypothetical protein K443DRAFT_161498 [Laccaria amethystina LaAM-08-1]
MTPQARCSSFRSTWEAWWTKVLLSLCFWNFGKLSHKVFGYCFKKTTDLASRTLDVGTRSKNKFLNGTHFHNLYALHCSARRFLDSPHEAYSTLYILSPIQILRR